MTKNSNRRRSLDCNRRVRFSPSHESEKPSKYLNCVKMNFPLCLVFSLLLLATGVNCEVNSLNDISRSADTFSIVGVITTVASDGRDLLNRGAESRNHGQYSNHSLFQSTKFRVLLNNGQFVAIPNSDGTFKIPDLPSNRYLLSVVHPHLLYMPVMVEAQEVESGSGLSVRAFAYDYPYATSAKLKYPLKLRPHSIMEYDKMYNWTIWSYLRNPLVILALFSIVVLYGIPILQKHVSQEEVNEIIGTEEPDAHVSQFMEYCKAMKIKTT